MGQAARDPRLRLGEALVQEGVITREQLASAIARQRSEGRRLGEVLLDMRLVTERDVTEVLARQANMPFIDLASYVVDPAVAALVPEHVAERHRLLPISKVGRRLTVAMADPLDIIAMDDVRLLTGLEVRPMVATLTDIQRALQEAYRHEKDRAIIEGLKEPGEGADPEVDVKDLQDPDENDGPIIRLVDLVIAQAVLAGASDIHVEPKEHDLRIRYRRDGLLQTAFQPPRHACAAIISRIKILAGMDIAERRMPQDGRIKTRVGERAIDIRVSTMPLPWGEKVVMRILDQSSLRPALQDLGFEPSSLTRFQSALRQPHGIILVTGPTGSGKTTTLYSALTTLNDPQRNIVTAEDPIEYMLDGVNQVQCKADIGLTFAHVLRTFLRQDPNVIMVGEIRDPETAEIAVKASMTGHLVLSTLHTNDAPGTVGRLLDLGVESYLLASSLLVVQAQRLVRTVCRDCRLDGRGAPDLLRALGIDEELLRRLDLPHIDVRDVRLYHGKGCASCEGTGYRGRVGIYEVMSVGERVRESILRGGSPQDLARTAREEGMLTLRESALRKALLGLTTADEVVRVTSDER